MKLTATFDDESDVYEVTIYDPMDTQRLSTHAHIDGSQFSMTVEM